MTEKDIGVFLIIYVNNFESCVYFLFRTDTGSNGDIGNNKTFNSLLQKQRWTKQMVFCFKELQTQVRKLSGSVGNRGVSSM